MVPSPRTFISCFLTFTKDWRVNVWALLSFSSSVGAFIPCMLEQWTSSIHSLQTLSFHSTLDSDNIRVHFSDASVAIINLDFKINSTIKLYCRYSSCLYQLNWWLCLQRLATVHKHTHIVAHRNLSCSHMYHQGDRCHPRNSSNSWWERWRKSFL